MSGGVIGINQRTPFPVDEDTQAALTVLAGDPDNRALIELDNPGLVHSDVWAETTDLLTGLTIAVRRADCGAGCRCAAEVKLVQP